MGAGLVGCATVGTALNPEGSSNAIAVAGGFKKQVILAGEFTLCAFAKIERPGEPLAIYIEGDGLAWKGRYRISGDPTPLHPLMLRLASLDPHANVVYLARPGQYLTGQQLRSCDPKYWTSHRFSEEVIAAMEEAVGYWGRAAKAKQIELIGYSGGGAVAVLVADRRKDIQSIRTIAGNLDPTELNRLHSVSALAPGPDTMTAAPRLAELPQRHFIGTLDTIVSSSIAERFNQATGASGCLQITRVDGATHGSGWIENWERLRALPVSCGNSD